MIKIQFDSFQVKPGADFFNKLPAELVLLVFKWLPKCSLAKCARGLLIYLFN